MTKFTTYRRTFLKFKRYCTVSYYTITLLVVTYIHIYILPNVNLVATGFEKVYQYMFGFHSKIK